MNRPDIGRLFCGVAGLLIAFSASAATWYVDDDNYGKPDLDGKTEASAFGTIKDALENAGLKAHDYSLHPYLHVLVRLRPVRKSYPAVQC